MLSLPVGWEVSNISGGGVNLVLPVNRDLTILGYQFDLSIGFLSGAAGFAEVLCYGTITAPGAAAFAPGRPQYLNGPLAGNGDIGASSFDNPDGFAVGGSGGGWSGAFFQAILKTWAPTAADRPIGVTGLSIAAPAGSSIVLHADHLGIPGDFEMQGVIFYE